MFLVQFDVPPTVNETCNRPMLYLALNSDASLVRYGRNVEAWKMLAKTMPATAGDVWSLKATQATAVVMTQMTPRTSQRRWMNWKL